MIKDEFGNRRFPGVYRGVVSQTDDPLNMGRVKLQVPQVMASAVTNWAWGVNQVTGEPPVTPSVGQGIWVMFEGGDPSFPVWIGTFGNLIP
jgi:hypothetical protein